MGSGVAVGNGVAVGSRVNAGAGKGVGMGIEGKGVGETGVGSSGSIPLDLCLTVGALVHAGVASWALLPHATIPTASRMNKANRYLTVNLPHHFQRTSPRGQYHIPGPESSAPSRRPRTHPAATLTAHPGRSKRPVQQDSEV